jgi:hypothetical protein
VRLVVLGLLLLWLLWLFVSSASFVDCVQKRQNAQPYKQFDEEVFFVFNFLRFSKLTVVCAVHVANDFQGAIAGAAAIAVAAFTYALWISTEKLWGVAYQQRLDDRKAQLREAGAQRRASRAMAKQLKLARDEFNSTHRPRIILREATTGELVDGQEIDVTMVFANVGDTVGTIQSLIAAVVVVDEDTEKPLGREVVTSRNDFGQMAISPGGQVMVNYGPAHGAPIWDANAFANRTAISMRPMQIHDRGPAKTIHLAGQLVYRDEAGIDRRTAFRRALRPKRQRFYRLPDDYEPDLDYAD